MAFGLVSQKEINEYQKLNLRERGNNPLIPKKIIEWEQIDRRFMEHFKMYLLNATYAITRNGKEILENFSKNYIAKQLKNLKQFLNDAAMSGYIKDNTYRSVKCEWEEADTVYTTWDEIELLKKLKLESGSNMEKVRDLYVFNCYCGLRYSDLSKLTKEDFITFDEQVYIKVRTKKTDDLLKFPILPSALKILKKYKFSLPYVNDNTFNETIKKVCLKAGITGIEKKRITKGGTKTVEMIPKYLSISSHTGRRSFATNFDEINVPLNEIMPITGHTTEKSLRTYIRKKQETKFAGFLKIGADV